LPPPTTPCGVSAALFRQWGGGEERERERERGALKEKRTHLLRARLELGDGLRHVDAVLLSDLADLRATMG